MLPNGFQRNQVPSSMVGKIEAMFPTINFLACQILGIVVSQIKTLRIFL
jgi:hypothetical protein